MKTLSIYTRLKTLSYRFITKLYIQYSHRGLPPLDKAKEKEKQKKLENYLYSGTTLLPSTSSIVIYAATIGELRAANQFILKLQQKFPDCLLILVPGQIQYAEVFAKIYPAALVINEFPVLPSLVDNFFDSIHAKLCIFIEGPSLHGYFPIRQDLSLSAGCLWHNIPLFVVNACLYQNAVASRIDLIEHKLFSSILRDAILQWYVPNPEIEKDFLHHDIPREKLLVTGDIKLDNVFSEPLAPISSDLDHLFEFYKRHNCRLLVAGSVNEYDEQIALILAWSSVSKSFPDAVLVLVPRYINNQIMMSKLYQFLSEQNIPYVRRSQGMEAMRPDALLVVDVFGELPYFYEHAEIAFAGRGHGILEPMKFSKPVVVGPRNTWEKVGTTAYHLFEKFLDKEALIECTDYDKLDDLFATLLRDPEYGTAYIKKYTQFIEDQLGASNRIVDHIYNQLLSNDLS